MGKSCRCWYLLYLLIIVLKYMLCGKVRKSMDRVKGILLGPPGCAQVFPYLSPGPLDLWWYEKNE
jgi:hypothetical protein